jgi:hypothetical protein
MEALKVKKKDVLVFNLILFLCLSFIFLYLQYAYRHHLSPFSVAYLKKSIELFWYAILPMMACGLFIWKHHRWSLSLYSFCVLLVGYKVIEGLFIEFNKIIVIALFFYAVISYFLYQLYGHYLALASLNANYSSFDLFDPLLKQIPCKLTVQEQAFSGYLTNWDEEGCFIKLSKPLILINKAKVVIDFKGRSFEQEGELVAHSVDLTGIGIKFGLSPKELNLFNWSEFNELIEELGFKPERLR